tara:strand:- start:312 stop:491 length:180 start_codon:yes stop_codon:yes gene_type:complete
MYPIKIKDKIYPGIIFVNGIWKLYSDSEDESDSDWEEIKIDNKKKDKVIRDNKIIIYNK